eukprot:CAMPEP_0170482536 /NCGR_PEP_ID=MMETSP0208-20121228/2512_1 /TAXON_ID=197538 /ORGANISM="Strombidium inclinatum, Strain S3" /LENGTH=190 /DNA_ID=CAMNT_0010755385 /DNA_START=226 /DNA_END=798 /DNA_ORIENTATION=+
MASEVRSEVMGPFHLHEILEHFQTFREAVQQLNQSDQLWLFEVLGALEEDFEGGAQSFDLYLTVQAAFIAADAVEHPGNVVELILNIFHELRMCVLNELLLIEAVAALSDRMLQQVGNVEGGLQVGLLADTRRVVVVLELVLHAIHCPDDHCVDHEHVLESLGVGAQAPVELVVVGEGVVVIIHVAGAYV